MIRILAILFIISIFIPVEFYFMIGTVRIETYRIVLALVMIFAIINLKTILDRANLTDLLLIILVIIAFFSFLSNHGLQKAIQSTGIYALETLGAFYLARLYIITPERFFKVNLAFITIITLLLGFTVYESFSQHRILHEWAEKITGNKSLDYRLYTDYYIRNGIMRATSLFAHPILFGTLAAMFTPFALMLAWRSRKLSHVGNVLALAISMLMTLSSAPLLSLIFQAMTATLVRFWNTARRVWVAIFFGGLASAMLIELLSNRGFFGILISYLTFNPNTGYFRMLQWENSFDDIMSHPILGIAHNDWTRPYWMSWMSDSIDSFWLLVTLQYGVFAFLVLFIACLFTVFHVLNNIEQHSAETRWMVTSWILSMMSLILIAFTVHYFDKLQPMFFFMLGACGWEIYYRINQTYILDAPTKNNPEIQNVEHSS